MTGSSLDRAELREQLRETREEIARVDGKASILLAGAAVAVGAILAGIVASDVQVGELPGAVLATTGLSAAAIAAGLGLLGAAIYPRCGTPTAARARYFAEVARFDTQADLQSALARDAAEGDRLIHQLFGLSKLAVTKYSLLRLAIWSLAIASASGAISVLLNLASE